MFESEYLRVSIWERVLESECLRVSAESECLRVSV